MERSIGTSNNVHRHWLLTQQEVPQIYNFALFRMYSGSSGDTEDVLSERYMYYQRGQAETLI